MRNRTAIVAAMIGASIAFAAPAGAAPSGATRAEYDQVQAVLPAVQSGNGTTRWEVEHLFGERGTRVAEWTVPGGTRLLKAYKSVEDSHVFLVSYFRWANTTRFRTAVKLDCVQGPRSRVCGS